MGLSKYPVRAVKTPLDVAIANNNAFSVGTDRSATSASLVSVGYFRATIANPTGSGRRIIVYSIEINNSAAAFAFADLYYNPTAGLPTASTLTPKNQQYSAANTNNTSIAVVKADAQSAAITLSATAMSGGQKQYPIGIPPSARTVYNSAQYVIHPGVTLGFNLAYLGAALAGIAPFAFSIIVNFYEETI